MRESQTFSVSNLKYSCHWNLSIPLSLSWICMRQQNFPATVSSMEDFSTVTSVKDFPARTVLHLMFFPVAFFFFFLQLCLIVILKTSPEELV